MAENDDDAADVDEQWIESETLDGGSGTQSFEFGPDWVAYLAEMEIPGNVSGVDTSIEDFGEEEGVANV